MDRSAAPFRQIAEALREQIRSGNLEPGDRLPSVRILADQWGVARGTVDRALSQLRDEGLIRTTAGRAGTVVAKEGGPTKLTLAIEGTRVHEVEAVDIVTLDDAQAYAIGVPAGSSLVKITLRTS